jgi:DNA-binding CsgD family transcriptional regulator/tetratricopeptide (TPR) repeat protein
MGGRMSSGRFVGREEELELLDAALALACEGRLAGVVVGGEAGIGKTRLVHEFVDRAAGAGARVLSGSCPAVAEGGVAFAPMVEALRGLVRQFSGPMLDWLVGDGRAELALLLPQLADRDVPPAPQRTGDAFGQQRLFGRLLDVLERLAGEEPVVLVIEDLHWADRSTRQLLSFLARNLRSVGVMLVGTYRTENLRGDDPLRGFLLELDQTGMLERVELGPLDAGELRALLEGVLGVAPAAAVCDDIVARSDGNAFFAEELLGALRRGDDRLLPPTLRDLLLHRVELLDELGRQVLGIAAVAGRTVEHRLLAAVADLDGDALIAGVREAVAHHLLLPRPDGRSYAFRHALTQEAVYAELPAGDRLRLHAAVARILGGRPEDGTASGAATLAHHWDAAGEPQRALPARVKAGLAAEAVYGFAEAQQHLARAAALWREVDAPPSDLGLDRIDLLGRAARAADFAGDYLEAARLRSEALVGADALRAAVLLQGIGESHVLAGDEMMGVAQMRSAMDRLPADAPPRVRADLLAHAGIALIVGGHPEEARVACEEAILEASQVGDPVIEARARNALGPALVMLGDIDGGIAHLRQARALAQHADDIKELMRSYLNLGTGLAIAGRLAESVESDAEGIARAAQLGVDRWYGALLLSNRAYSLWCLGRWDEAEDATAQALALALAPTGRAGQFAHLNRAVIAMGRGHVDSAERALAATRSSGDAACHPAMAEVEAELALWQGDAGAASAAVAEGLPRQADAPVMDVVCLLWLGLRAAADGAADATALHRAVAATEHRRAAEALLLRSRQLTTSLPVARGYLALCEAEWSRVEQRHAPDCWNDVAEHWEGLAHPYHAAYARWRQAEALAGAQVGGEEVAALLRAAHARANALGATPLCHALELLAMRTRTSLVIESATTSPLPGPADELGLTDREHEVLLLLAEGRTNQQIGALLHIAAKTASVHVSNILRKLDVANRGEAAAVAHRLGLAPAPASHADPSVRLT